MNREESKRKICSENFEIAKKNAIKRRQIKEICDKYIDYRNNINA